MSSGVTNDVWEQEKVSRMLDLTGDEDDEGEEDSDDAPSPPAPVEPPAVDQQEQSQDSERWSDITDPFEEFHRKGALQTEVTEPAPALQPPGSRRSQFLRDVSLFSAAHQLAVLEVRDEQGVSLLERSTSLTAESLDLEHGVALLKRSTSLTAESLDLEHGVASLASLARSTSLPADHLLQQDLRTMMGRLAAVEVPVGVHRGTRCRPPRRSRTSKAFPAQTDLKQDARDGVPGESGTTLKSRDLLPLSGTAVSAGIGQTPPSDIEVGSGSSGGSSGESSILDTDPSIDPTLAALLRELWTDSPRPEPKQSPRLDAAGAAGAAGAASSAGAAPKDRRKSSRDREPDVLSGLWRMLDCYADFKCTPPDFHAFRQDKPHWLDQEPIPWAVRESARQKCSRWLMSCPQTLADRAWEMSLGRRETLESLGRRRSTLTLMEPPPQRSLTSTPALAEAVPAITAVRKLKQYRTVKS